MNRGVTYLMNRGLLPHEQRGDLPHEQRGGDNQMTVTYIILSG